MEYTLNELDEALKNIRNKISYYEVIMLSSKEEKLKNSANENYKIHCSEFERVSDKYNKRLAEIIK